MSLKKFAKNDVVINTMKAYPSCEFFVYESRIFYNNTPIQSGAFSAAVRNVPAGHLSLYEYNTDRAKDVNPFIFPFITASGDRYAFNTISTTGSEELYTSGEVLTSSYPMSASITREYMATAGETTWTYHTIHGLPTTYRTRTPRHRHYYALKNTLEYNGIRNANYRVLGPYNPVSGYAWNKDDQSINLISIPSIFFGSQVKPGSISLKWYYTGSLIGELQDIKQDGTLIQVGPAGSAGSGSIAGVALYDQGFLLLTGSWDLKNVTLPLLSGSTSTSDRKAPSWLFYGAGANDKVTVATTTAAGPGLASASFGMSFKGTSETQVMTMFARARRGEANYSNNPSFLNFGQEQLELTSSRIYEENSSRTLYNSVSSSYEGYSAPFKRQLYISKVAIYDDKKNFIGVATLANPVLKEDDQEFTLKLRLDI